MASDITPWMLRGYSAVAMVDSAPWRVSGELWGMDLPSALIEQNTENAEEGWARRVNAGLALTVDRHLGRRPDNQGWHVGLLLNAFHSTVTRQAQSGRFWSVEALGRGGFRWFPSEQERFFVNPYAALGPLVGLDTPRVAGERFVEVPYQAVATVQLGWCFR